MVSAPTRQFPLVTALALVLLALLTACDRGPAEERPGSGPTDREPAATERESEDATPIPAPVPTVVPNAAAPPAGTTAETPTEKTPTPESTTTLRVAATATPIPTPVPTVVPNAAAPPGWYHSGNASREDPHPRINYHPEGRVHSHTHYYACSNGSPQRHPCSRGHRLTHSIACPDGSPHCQGSPDGDLTGNGQAGARCAFSRY